MPLAPSIYARRTFDEIARSRNREAPLCALPNSLARRSLPRPIASNVRIRYRLCNCDFHHYAVPIDYERLDRRTNPIPRATFDPRLRDRLSAILPETRGGKKRESSFRFDNRVTIPFALASIDRIFHRLYSYDLINSDAFARVNNPGVLRMSFDVIYRFNISPISCETIRKTHVPRENA